MNRSEDILTEFDEFSKKPKHFILLFVIMLITIVINICLEYPDLKDLFIYGYKNNFSWYMSIWLIIYPGIGAFYYYYSKKLGWFLISHFSLSLVVLYFTGFMIFIFDRDLSIGRNYFRFSLITASLILNFYSLAYLFKRPYLEYFNLNRSHIFSIVVLTIVFPLLNAAIFSLFSFD